MARLKPEYINVKEVPALVESVREAFDSGRTRPASWRRAQLEGIKRMMHERESDISAALYADLGKPAMEAFSAEIQHTEAEADDALSNLDSWMKPRKVKTPMFAQPGKSEIKPEPYGVALIIAPWNYPLSLVMSPLVGAIAAGNAAVIKPSEVAANTSALLAELVPRYLDERCIKVVEGAVPETTALLEQRFDHIFYTGSTSVGRIVMKAAAEHLTPVTLELGGKSPCVVDERIDLKTAARRIAWGKFWNAGQTCIAPDYILAHDRVHDDLVHALEATLREFYGDDPKQSPDYARIINERHFRRLAGLAESGRTVIGGDLDEEQRYISPSLTSRSWARRSSARSCLFCGSRVQTRRSVSSTRVRNHSRSTSSPRTRSSRTPSSSAPARVV